MLVVLDTNIIVSALLSPHGKPAYVFNRFINGDFTLCADERIIAEYIKLFFFIFSPLILFKPAVFFAATGLCFVSD